MAPLALHQNHILTDTNEKQECETADKTALQAISKGVCLPGIPIFNDFEKQRHWMLEHMALAFQVFARKGTSHPHHFPPLFIPLHSPCISVHSQSNSLPQYRVY